MRHPSSPYFTPIPLTAAFNADRARLDGRLDHSGHRAGGEHAATYYGSRPFKGIPFALGSPDEPNVVLLTPGEDALHVPVGGILATYLVVLHAVEDAPLQEPFAPFPNGGVLPGNAVGGHVSTYRLVYGDGTVVDHPIERRFAIQQWGLTWGASPFVAVPALGPAVFSATNEDAVLGRVAGGEYGRGETRTDSLRGNQGDTLWLYALPNPRPDVPIEAIVLSPETERSVVYGISATTFGDHPLRPGVRQKLRLTLPDGVVLNDMGELDTDSRDPAIGIDLGVVISARQYLAYDAGRWSGDEPNVQPVPDPRSVVVEYAAHPQGRLSLATGPDTIASVDLPTATGAAGELEVAAIPAANRPVTIRVEDAATGQPVPVRIHLHGAAGEYLPPRGNHRKVNPYWFEDNYGEFVNGQNQYAYIPGECIVDLPLGTVFVEISRGYEIAPIRTEVTVTPETDRLSFTLERRLPWRERGWVTADTHVHFLSPTTALLEGAAEGVNVVNLLASQWGEMFSNVTDFDGRTTLGARDFGGDGEFLVRVGTENRMQVLGHISLLGYSGRMIHPLCTGGPDESAIGDPQEVTMAEWASRCIEQGGLVVMPHGPNPNAERAADIVLGLIDAIEMMTFNPFDKQISPYGLADWYRYQNLGYQIPLSGGSDKMAAAMLLGGVRTYAHLGGREFAYGSWMDAMRAGNTFVTVGPLIEFAVEGQPAGRRIELPAGGGTVDVTWEVASIRCPVDTIEVIVGGLAVAEISVDGFAHTGHLSVPIDAPTWIGLRVRGSLTGRPNEIAAHSSAVQLRVDGRGPFSTVDAANLLEQIEGTLAYIDTIAPRPDVQRYRRLRQTMETAHARLHDRLHAQGAAHNHSPVHIHHGHHGH